jgi:hypothetical protein
MLEAKKVITNSPQPLEKLGTGSLVGGDGKVSQACSLYPPIGGLAYTKVLHPSESRRNYSVVDDKIDEYCG